ncbi:MAG: AIR synthase-related protein [Candidatus Pacebacteria bacterium]|nr:AIR synthase-related protein [Candidatus Paceibacterota bacterium]NUQ57261.1 phosphoribosylformylglycinamidine cyclo-ligase [Candidatus Paceibacter sp.]
MITYKDCGVDYGNMDPHKRESMLEAMQTDEWLERFGFSIVPWTRGESATLVETPFGYIGFVVEGLGTKNLVADAVKKILRKTGRDEKTFYDYIAQCNTAMAFNDLITVGARPFLYGQYLAAGSSSWFKEETRRRELIKGTKNACDAAKCCWGGGETPTLQGIIYPDTVDLAGAVVGFIPLQKKGQIINPAKIKHGDAIVMIESSGIHANGLTLARKIAEKEPLWRRLRGWLFPWLFKKSRRLPKGYKTVLSDGRTYGESLLDPTHVYVGLVEDCLDKGIDIHYAVNITGHGWRKLMRAPQQFTYVIESIPRPQPVFQIIIETTGMSLKEAYGTFNMGAGFALYVDPKDSDQVIDIARRQGREASRAGHIEEGEKKVVIKPLNIEFGGDELKIR